MRGEWRGGGSARVSDFFTKLHILPKKSFFWGEEGEGAGVSDFFY